MLCTRSRVACSARNGPALERSRYVAEPHPRKHGEVPAWFRRAVAEHELLLSEFADYELRPTGDGTGDLLLVVQAREELAAIVTLNEKHFGGLVDVSTWPSVPMSSPN